jgi:plasminogen activator
MKLLRIRWAGVSILFAAAVMLSLEDSAGAASDPFMQNKGAKIISSETDSGLAFNMGIGAGYMSGEATEIVYWPQNNNHKASELTWDIDELFLFGFNAELDIHRWIKVKLDTWFKAADGEGTMDDYDWQIVGADWTDWSHHEDTDVTEAYLFDVSGEFTFYRSESTAFHAIIGYKADNFGWESRGGYYTYTGNSFRDTQGSFADGQLGISYEQTYSSPYIGIGTELTFTKFRTQARFIYAPYVYGEATDHHYLRNLETRETFDEYGEGDMVALDLSGSYSFSEDWSLHLGLKYQAYSSMTGDAKWIDRTAGTVYYSADGAGMDQTSTMFTTALKYAF